MSENHPERFLRIKSKSDKYEYFSKGILVQSLFSIGMNTDQAQEIANKVAEKVSMLSETQTKKKLILIQTKMLII